MKLSDLEKEAIKLVGIEGWSPWCFEMIHNGVLCTGAVCPPISRGKNKGDPNYRKADKATIKRVVVPFKSRRTGEVMEFKRIGQSSDWESDCGQFHITACNDNFNGAYWPTKKIDEGRFKCLTRDSTNWDDAKKVCESYREPAAD